MVLAPTSNRDASCSMLQFLPANHTRMSNLLENRVLDSHCSLSASTAAWASATSTDLSALPILSLPSKLRTIYLASTSWHAASSFVIMDTFLACDECPVTNAISRKFWKTKGRVKGLGLNRVFWLFFEFCPIPDVKARSEGDRKRTHHGN